METALITGVAGFIGSSLAEKLLKNNFKVIGIDSFTNYYSTRIKEKNIENCLKHPNFSLIHQDLDTLDLSVSIEKAEYFFSSICPTRSSCKLGERVCNICEK